ncbi:MATE family efflux transporter [Motiliproteus sp. SC1-56]|uniref:MATE family efflux transporter n=1 Tax=Motiliproteus sp. SC1-56 TaxID=2799565 RepID=UPI001F5D37DB|nr:MATE family efflux transporter [Motiliproteus sp. SC1-56]
MQLAIDRQRLNAILALGVPIIGGMLSQSLLNLVDTAMVGALGGHALAGVGIGSYANFMVVALVIGLSAGVQTLVARRRGEGRHHEAALPLNGGLLLALLLCLPLTLIAHQGASGLVGLISDAPEVTAAAVPYFEYRTLAILAVGLNVCFRGYWNGINRSLVYLRILVVTHLLNVALSYVLIFGAFGYAGLGAPGAGLGTSLALWVGAILCALMTARNARQNGFLRRMPAIDEIAGMLRLSLPVSLQQLMFAISVTMLFWIIARIGTDELAIAHVLIHLALFLILPAVGLGMAATTLVSQALGRRQPEQACQWGWDIVKLATLVLMTLSVPLVLFPEAILGVFIRDPALIERAVLPLQLTCLAICLDTAAIVFTQALLGAGANRTVMAVTSLGQWGFYLPLAWLVGPYLGGGLLGIWLVQLLHRALSSVVFSYIWARRSWIHIKI